MAMTDALIPEFDQEMANTRKILERCPEGKNNWKPHPKSFDFGHLASHVVNMVGWGTDILKADFFDIPKDYKEDPFQTNAELLKKFDQNVASMRGALTQASDQEMMKPWTLRSGETVYFTMPRAVVLRSFVFNHMIHHRAQLTVYLRLNDIAVPGVYGPSADDGPM
jgi:uncharacterized damage-inducible protein DinB